MTATLQPRADCQTELRAAGVQYPKTCTGCGLTGPCLYHADVDDRFGQRWFESVNGGSSLDTGPGFKPNPPPFPDNIKLTPGWWKSRNGMIFNIVLTADGKNFAAANPDGVVEPGNLFAWHSDGMNRYCPVGDGEPNQDFALIERVTVGTQPLPVVGSFVVAIVADPSEKDGWRAAIYREGVPGDTWNHVQGIIATKVVRFVEGERE